MQVTYFAASLLISSPIRSRNPDANCSCPPFSSKCDCKISSRCSFTQSSEADNASANPSVNTPQSYPFLCCGVRHSSTSTTSAILSYFGMGAERTLCTRGSIHCLRIGHEYAEQRGDYRCHRLLHQKHISQHNLAVLVETLKAS